MSNDYWQGEHIRLRGLESFDWELFYTADHDEGTVRGLYGVPFPRGKEATRQWVERTLGDRPDGDNYFFLIENSEEQAVGSIATHDCNRRMGTFKYGVAVIEGHRGKGYASEAIKLVLRYYFVELGYQKVNAEVFSFNEASQRMHEKLGFRLEGRLRKMIRSAGALHDVLIFGMTAEEFRELHARED